MFAARQKPVHVQEQIKTFNEFNEEEISLKDKGTINMYIVVSAAEVEDVESLHFKKTNLIGFTDSLLNEGDVIDQKYKVVLQTPSRTGYITYLECYE